MNSGRVSKSNAKATKEKMTKSRPYKWIINQDDAGNLWIRIDGRAQPGGS